MRVWAHRKKIDVLVEVGLVVHRVVRVPGRDGEVHEALEIRLDDVIDHVAVFVELHPAPGVVENRRPGASLLMVVHAYADVRILGQQDAPALGKLEGTATRHAHA